MINLDHLILPHHHTLTVMLVRSTRVAGSQIARFASAAATQTAEQDILHLELRHAEGSRAARRLRKQGYLPGILYGEDTSGNSEKVLVQLKTRSFERLHRKLWSSVENQVFDLHVGNSPDVVKAVMRDVQLDVGTCFTYLRCESTY